VDVGYIQTSIWIGRQANRTDRAMDWTAVEATGTAAAVTNLHPTTHAITKSVNQTSKTLAQG